MAGLKDELGKYLGEQAGRDGAFRARYDAGRLDKCAEYVTDRARKHLKGQSGAVEDALVYKWARDYYNDVAPEEPKDGPADEPTDEPKPAKAKAKAKPAKAKVVDGPSLFGEEEEWL